MVAFTEAFDPIVAALREFAPVAARMEPHLEAAVGQAVSEPGKLIRARLVHAAARASGMGETEALQLACAVEYFHVASLLLDDLPCMDNADTRRGLPCVHATHGDATAILAALALINRAYLLAGFAFAAESPTVRMRAMACVDACLGPAGLVGGQAADLRFGEGAGGARAVSRIAAAKTGALFWLAVYLPALAGEPGEEESHGLKALCVYWGLAFQAMDDLGDLLRGEVEAGKTTGRDAALARPNLALALGAPAARARVARLFALSSAVLARLEAGSARWDYLRAFQNQVFEPARRRVLGEAPVLAAA